MSSPELDGENVARERKDVARERNDLFRLFRLYRLDP